MPNQFGPEQKSSQGADRPEHTEESAAQSFEQGAAKIAVGKVKPAVENVKNLAERVQELRVMRGLTRYGSARGGLLSGGIAYSGLFSVAAALTIAWTVFMAVLGSNEKLRQDVLEGVDATLPGIVDTGNGGGMIKPDSLVLDSAINLTSIIAFGVLLWTAISTMGAIATAIRAMFGISVVQENTIIVYLRSFGGFVVLAIGVLASSLLTAGAGVLGHQILRTLSIEGTFGGLFLRLLTFAVSLGVDMLVIAFLVRVMAGVRVVRRDLWLGCLIAGIGTSAIRILGTSAVGSVSNNALLASVAAIATLLLWLNLGARILLMACSFMANPPRPVKIESPEKVHYKETPNYITLSAPHTLDWPHNPITGNVTPEPDEAPAEQSEELPRWGGLLGNISHWKVRRLERRAAKADRKARRARAKYREGARKMVAAAARSEGSGVNRSKKRR